MPIGKSKFLLTYLSVFSLFFSSALASENEPVSNDIALNPLLIAKGTSSAKPFMLFTMPKTGTHLLEHLLGKMTQRKAVWFTSVLPHRYILDINNLEELKANPLTVQVHYFTEPVSTRQFCNILFKLSISQGFLYSHTPYTPRLEELLKHNNYVIFFVIRDPRDYVVSLLNYLQKGKKDLVQEDWFYKLDQDTQISYLLTGTKWYNSVTFMMNSFLPWKNSPICCPLRFEALLGPSGGLNTKAEQLNELRKIPKALGLKMTDQQLMQAFTDSYGKGSTFHKAKTGRWKQYFNETNKALCKELLGDILIELGYEKNYDW